MKIIFTDDADKTIKEYILSNIENRILAINTENIPEQILIIIKEYVQLKVDNIVTQSGRGSSFTDTAAKDQIIVDLITEKDPLVETAEDRRLAIQGA